MHFKRRLPFDSLYSNTEKVSMFKNAFISLMASFILKKGKYMFNNLIKQRVVKQILRD